jgi:CheY-like chemotaxis protein
MNHILIADYDADTRGLYREGVFSGDVVAEATDGRDALTKAFDPVPSLVLTELRLPFVDGFELCEILRRDALTRQVPIVVVTGEMRPAALERAHHVGADAVLIKPTPLEVIRFEVQRLLSTSAELRNRSAEILQQSASQQRVSAALLARSKGRPRMMLSRAYPRGETTTPFTPPPTLSCPVCDQQLHYERSHIGGVSARHPEQWDYYACPRGCGDFQYRQRTRRTRQL